MNSAPPEPTLNRLHSMTPDGFVTALTDIIGHGAWVTDKGLYNTKFAPHAAPIRFSIAEPDATITRRR